MKTFFSMAAAVLSFAALVLTSCSSGANAFELNRELDEMGGFKDADQFVEYYQKFTAATNAAAELNVKEEAIEARKALESAVCKILEYGYKLQGEEREKAFNSLRELELSKKQAEAYQTLQNKIKQLEKEQ